ncbi:phosphotransferase family protein [Micromonospora zhanjiangensis]|uniref:Phosphotransferase family protein n=1 Tax=Micromonospora zhanjiangensis TaxID=1522057 RepID=A0ABV8KWD9_9ACTN
MPVPLQHTPEKTRELLQEWIRQRTGDADVLVGDVEIPRVGGFSNETLFFTLSGSRVGQLVARVAPTGHQVYPDPNFRQQYEVQRALHLGGAVRVPRPHWYEEDPHWLGAPFFVMDQVSGRTPADFPSYHRTGWVADLTPAARSELWYAAVRAMHDLHRLDPRRLPLGPVPRSGLEAVHRTLRRYAARVSFFEPDFPDLTRRTLDRLDAMSTRLRPVEPVPLWGDARIGNMVFDDRGVAALLDFEMAGTGPAEMDLAWFLYLDRHLSEGIGATRLPGLPDAAETVAHYQELAGRSVVDLRFYELLAGFQFFLITARVTRLAIASGIVTSRSDLPLHDNAARLLTRVLTDC